MRKFAIAVVLLCLFASATVNAANDKVVEGMVQKGVRGAINMVTGIVELPMQIYKGYDKGFGPIKNTAGSKTVGTILGIFRGFGHAAGRTSWGALELFGFWTANAPDNDGVGVPLDAQYSWQMGEQYSIFKPTLGEGVKPIGRKLIRGLTDAFLGIVELPGQVVKGAREKTLVKGAAKGVWFWWSREAYGFTGMFTCLVPNPKDNPGYAFNGEWPWSALLAEEK